MCKSFHLKKYREDGSFSDYIDSEEDEDLKATFEIEFENSIATTSFGSRYFLCRYRQYYESKLLHSTEVTFFQRSFHKTRGFL